MKPLACLGIAVLDKLFQVEGFPTTGGKYVAKGYREVGGGPAATAACAAVRLGHACHLMARIGNDSCGNAIAEELRRYGVDTRWLHRIDGAVSGVSGILVDQHGERMIINYQDPTLDVSADWLDQVDFGDYAALLVDVRWMAGAEKALDAARKAGIPTVLDADMNPASILPLVQRADHVAFSHPGLAKLTGTDDVEQGLRKAATMTHGRVYVTVGKDGCYWLEEDRLEFEPGLKVAVVDTTGAGDVFHGALLVAIAEGFEMRRAMRFANQVAALKCTRSGGRDGIPSRAQVDECLK